MRCFFRFRRRRRRCRAINFWMTKFECAINYFAAILQPKLAMHIFCAYWEIVCRGKRRHRPKIQPKNLKRPTWWRLLTQGIPMDQTPRTERVSILVYNFDGLTVRRLSTHSHTMPLMRVSRYTIYRRGDKLPFFLGLLMRTARAINHQQQQQQWKNQTEKKAKTAPPLTCCYHVVRSHQCSEVKSNLIYSNIVHFRVNNYAFINLYSISENLFICVGYRPRGRQTTLAFRICQQTQYTHIALTPFTAKRVHKWKWKRITASSGLTSDSNGVLQS